MDNKAKDILKKHNEEDKRRAMAKRMAEEEQKRQDINVQHWDGMQSNKSYIFSIGSGKWSQMGTEGKIFFVLGVVSVILVVALLIFMAIKSFSVVPILYD